MFKFTNSVYNEPLLVYIRSLADKYGFTVDHTIDGLTQGADHHVFMSDGWDQYFFNNLFKKLENVDLGLKPTERAIEKFESFLAEQNDYVSYMSIYLDNLGTSDQNQDMYKILKYTEDFLLKALKDVRIYKINPRHSNGATIGCRKGSSIIDKTRDSGGIDYLLEKADRRHEFGVQLYWALNKIPFVKGNNDFHIEIDTVPKTAKIDRVIGKGPTAVIAVQNGFGDLLGDVLKKYCDIDMSTAQDIHKDLVVESSLSGEWSTLDLEGGSNNIWRHLVYRVLRKRSDLIWLLDVISPSTFVAKYEGGENRIHTSSMLALQGNGFIMNFQTLFYYSLIKGIQRFRNVDHKIYVFGDDIIVNSNVADDVIKVFNFLKLKINVEKSFTQPPFFESCGMDAIYGNNIRPYYVRDLPKQTDHWYRLANGIRRVCYYNNSYNWRSSASYDLWKWVVRNVRKNARFYGPRIYGDAVLNIEASFLYTFGKPQRGDREYLLRETRGIKYPNEGKDANGNPYSSERIKVRTVKESDFQNSFGSAIKGLPGNTVLKLSLDPALSKKGWKVVEVEGVTQYDDNGNPMYRYPYVFNSRGEMKQNSFVPYTPWGRSPSDSVDDLFSKLIENGNEVITDTNHVLAVYQRKLLDQRVKLISSLRGLVAKRRHDEKVAKGLTFEL